MLKYARSLSACRQVSIYCFHLIVCVSTGWSKTVQYLFYTEMGSNQLPLKKQNKKTRVRNNTNVLIFWVKESSFVFAKMISTNLPGGEARMCTLKLRHVCNPPHGVLEGSMCSTICLCCVWCCHLGWTSCVTHWPLDSEETCTHACAHKHHVLEQSFRGKCFEEGVTSFFQNCNLPSNLFMLCKFKLVSRVGEQNCMLCKKV